MRKIERRSNCPISYSLDFLGDKWVLLIFRDMIFRKYTYFKQFLSSSEKIATNVLSDRLKMLESNEFVYSQVDSIRKNMKVYKLTQKGKDLIPVLLELTIWAKHYGNFGDDTEELKQYVNTIKEDREAFIKKTLEELE